MLFTVTVNEVPLALGVNVFGEIVHVGGAPFPQLKVTELSYPFEVLTEPLKTVGVLTTPVRVGFEMLRA